MITVNGNTKCWDDTLYYTENENLEFVHRTEVKA